MGRSASTAATGRSAGCACSLDPADLAATDAAAWAASTRTVAGRTATTSTGCETLRRTDWWWDRRRASSIPRGGEGAHRPRLQRPRAPGQDRAVVIGRDHHDVSGTDSPYRETSNIRDRSNVMADMAFHCWAGNRRPGHDPGGGFQRRGGRHREGDQHGVRTGAGWLGTGGRHHPLRRRVGRHGRGGPPGLGRNERGAGDGAAWNARQAAGDSASGVSAAGGEFPRVRLRRGRPPRRPATSHFRILSTTNY